MKTLRFNSSRITPATPVILGPGRGSPHVITGYYPRKSETGKLKAEPKVARSVRPY